MVLLDANERDTCTVNQRRTNTPLQALLLLNNVAFVETSRALGQRMLAHTGDDAARIDHAFQLVLARPPEPAERDILLRTLASARERFAAASDSARQLVNAGESPVPDGVDPIELAAHTVAARVLLNLDEAVTRQ